MLHHPLWLDFSSHRIKSFLKYEISFKEYSLRVGGKYLKCHCNIFLTYQTVVTNLHLLRVELRCKLQEKLRFVTGPLMAFSVS